ncbi:MAG: RtcB family protein, partial [Thermoanaerobaculia bacterium]|nr:RtcB family protein [Thermoanaerobaculia bacterium]
MKRKDLIQLGIGSGQLFDLSVAAVTAAAHSGLRKPAIRRVLKELVANPARYAEHPLFGELARAL